MRAHHHQVQLLELFLCHRSLAVTGQALLMRRMRGMRECGLHLKLRYNCVNHTILLAASLRIKYSSSLRV
jgi:hypothetical protein